MRKLWLLIAALLASNANAWTYSGDENECRAAHDGIEFFYREDTLHVRVVGIAPRSLHVLGREWKVHYSTPVRGYAVTVRTSADEFRTPSKVEVSIERDSAVFPWRSDWWWPESVRARATVQFYFHGNTMGGLKFPMYKVWTAAHPGSLSVVRRLEACEAVRGSLLLDEAAELPSGWGGG